VSSSLGWGKGFGEEFPGMHRKKRNKRSNDMMDITLKIGFHALRLSSIEIRKNVHLPSQLPVPISSSEEEDMHGSEEEDAHDSEEDARGREEDHWKVNEDEVNQVHSDNRSPMLDTVDKLTEPTVAAFWMPPGL
jgi:hypothetical protein